MGQTATVFRVKGIILESKNDKRLNQEVREEMTTERNVNGKMMSI